METETPVDAAQADANEERRARRQRVLMKGYVAFHNNFASVPCSIRNLSETGALIVLDAPVAVPPNFVLFAELAGFKVECSIAWQRGLALGVHFTGARENSRIARHQFVGTSEKALSEQTLLEMEMRDRREGRTPVPAVSGAGKTVVAKPAFGRKPPARPPGDLE